ncbi:hypothetical protein E2C01_042075 [Portunus trituberculatus]|uniref:Uncharacterized protein n=1 Tax=Portunus trituberculatus TaxID=210409 RepID=A0A5B7FSE8_PORTR|nr:hypothetical protein [Portunus trituberculatus]
MFLRPSVWHGWALSVLRLSASPSPPPHPRRPSASRPLHVNYIIKTTARELDSSPRSHWSRLDWWTL